MKTISRLLFFSVICALQIAAVPAGVPLWQVLGLTDDSVITTESKLDHIALEFSGVFTALQDITDIVVSDVSKLDGFNFVINVSLTVSQLDAINSGIDVVQSLVDSLEGCGVSGAISQADIGLTGYTITSAGSYFLTEDLFFNPVATNQTAIIIDADNVYLDLNGFTITQGNSTSGAGGISVLANRRNIKILNGIIRNMSGQSLAFIASVNNVYVKDLQILSAGLPGGGGAEAADGIESLGGSNYVFNNIVVQDAQDEGVDINGVFNFVFKNSNISFNGGTGILVDEGSSYGAIYNCIFENNFVSGIQRAATGDRSSGTVITGCVSARNRSEGINADSQWVVEDCSILGNMRDGIRNGIGAGNVIKNNTVIRNAVAGITADQPNCFIFRNTLIQNGPNNIPTPTVATSILGNYAFNTTNAGNYVSGGGTTINRSNINTTSPFATQPVFWRNISATP